MSGFATPEDAVRAANEVPAEYLRIVAIDESPTGDHAVVFIAFNEPPEIEPYVVLCERTATGWIEAQGGSGGGTSWMATTPDGSRGVETIWDPPTARWDAPPWGPPNPDAGAAHW